MRVGSIALRTSLAIQRSFGIVEDRGDYLVLRTPSVPDYWYGNCLAMPGPPGPGDYAAWTALFEAELPGRAHRVFLVDGVDGNLGAAGPFLERGFEASIHDVLATESPRRPERRLEGLEYRPFSSDGDWEAGVETSLAVNSGSPGYSRGYVERSFAATRGAVERGAGSWWGAWDGKRCAAQMGVFRDGGLARFRDVETHPEYRRRGACRTLLYRLCEAETAARGPSTFVISPEDDAVRRIYEAVGFSFRERVVDFCLKPPDA
ncbi:MAG: GNAT family N-acetyltransferase [Spirochaetes bacterium]|nr:GNAT family N-acetyltransferase [Spirochaetota bacterium]MBU1080025.1 GNAT family N-acetyltransferase [Spirochaetota bacterium]